MVALLKLLSRYLRVCLVFYIMFDASFVVCKQLIRSVMIVYLTQELVAMEVLIWLDCSLFVTMV